MAPKRAIKERPFSFIRRLKEISMFFAGKDEVHKSLRRLVKRLEKAGIAYAVMGGMAVNAHRSTPYHRRRGRSAHPGRTGGVPAALRQQELSATSRSEAGASSIESTTSGSISCSPATHPGSGEPGPFAFPDPEEASEVIGKIRVVNLVTADSAQTGGPPSPRLRRCGRAHPRSQPGRVVRRATCIPASARITSNVWKRNAATMNTMPAKADHRNPPHASHHDLQIPRSRGAEPPEKPVAGRTPGRRGLFRRHAQKPAQGLLHRVRRAPRVHARRRSAPHRLARPRPPRQALRQAVRGRNLPPLLSARR